ncbi:hypothetical protein [Butyrivibrio sp. LC3010]|uniref:hypothetical protein n=1 Tax=Butyrivibrio sp. LC3010 TaxID=1280680 RepID=UPI00040F88A8|nr:hypothetical protein [Butyrivibrio sp. LC3010]
MKGKNLKRIRKNAVVACIMAATITFSTADALGVSAEDAVSDGNALVEAPATVMDETDAAPTVNPEETDAAAADNPAQVAPDGNEGTTPGEASNDSEGQQSEDTQVGAGQNDSGEAQVTPAAPNELRLSGIAENSPVYDGQSHDVQVKLPVSTIKLEENDISAVVASDESGNTFYITGIPDNKVSVSAVNVSETAFDVAMTGCSVYNSELVQVTAPASLKITAENVIQKRPVTLKSMNLVKAYDGKPITNGDMPLAEESGWVEGQGADYSFTGSRTAVGASINEFVATPRPGTDFNNYRITYIFGDISVVERTNAQKYIITVEGNSNAVKYSGKEQSLSGYVLEGRSDSEFKINGTGDPSQVITVTIGDAEFSVTGISAYASGKNAGTYPVVITGSPVVRDADGNDVTNEFRFEFKQGEFTIEKRKVILTSASLKKKYNNKTIKAHEVTVSGDGFAEGEGASYKVTGKQKKIGQSYNYFTYELNEGTLPENYDIETVPGVLEVTKAGDTAINETPKESSGSSGDTKSSDDTSQSSGSTAPSQTQAGTADSSQQAQGAGSATLARATTAQNANVLGAKRGLVTVDIASPENVGKTGKDVLGARRASTDDDTNMEGHLFIFAAALLTAVMTIKRDKRLKK